MRVFLKAYPISREEKKEKKRKGGGRFRVRTPEIGPREKFVGAGGSSSWGLGAWNPVKFRTGPEDGCLALKLHPPGTDKGFTL